MTYLAVILAEIAACGTHSAVHRYTYPSGSILDIKTPSVVVDLFHSITPVRSHVSAVIIIDFIFRMRLSMHQPQ